MQRRGLSGLALAIASACGCAPYTEISAQHPGAVAALLVRVETATGRALTARAFDPRQAGPAFSIEPEVEAHVLSYPQALAEYGIALDEDGDLPLVTDGVPLPLPAHWTRVDGEGAATPLDVRATSPAEALAQVRVPARPCPRLVEDVGRRVPMPPGSTASFVGALDQERTLVAYGPGRLGDFPVTLGAFTGAAMAPVAYRGPPDWFLPPVGFTEADGTLWVALWVDGGDLRTDGFLCRFAADSPLDLSGCVAHADLPYMTRLDGRRREDGVMELVALDWNRALYHRVGDQPWRALYRGGRPPNDECSFDSPVQVLRLDGPGTGLVSFPGGDLERFRVTDEGVERTPQFDDEGRTTSCEGVYGRSAGGVEMYVELPRTVGRGQVTTNVWWRNDPAQRWRPVPHEYPAYSLSVMTLGETFLVTSPSSTVMVLDVDALRPDLPPRPCELVSVFNNATRVAPSPDGGLILGGEMPTDDTTASVSRWHLLR